MTKPTTALLTALLLAGCTRTDAETVADPGPDRIEAWQTVESYKIDQRMNILRSGQWLREPGNEDKSPEEAGAVLGLQELDPRPAVEAALRIARANPVDDLGFLALSFAFYELRSLDDPERQEHQESVYELLEAHYIDDLRLNRLLLSLVRFGGEPGVDLVDKVVAGSDQRVLRARGAFWSAMERLMEVDDLNRSPAERADVRAEVTRMAQLVADEYSDVEVFRGEPGGEAIKPVLYALENLAIGSVLPEAGGQRIGGDQESLSQYRGRVLLLDFWATWCAPCIASLPEVTTLQQLLGDRGFNVITISIDETMELVEQFMDRRMDLPFVNWYVGEGSQLYEDWAIQGVPTYVVVDRDGVVRGRSHEVESLYDVILEATGADGETRAKLVGDEAATPSAGSSDLAQPEYNIEAQEWITMPLAADTSIWTPPYFDAGGGEIWMITRSVPARDAGGIFAIVTTDLPVDAPGG